MKKSIKNILKKSILGEYFLNQIQEIKKYIPKFSYSQAGEDLVLNSLLLEKENGFYVDIGAYHPVFLSNTYLFYKKGWTGIQIEPNKKRSKLFRKKRKNSLTLEFGIGPDNREIDFYVFQEDTLCTFSKEAADLHCKLGHTLLYIEKVKVVPLREVFEQHVKDKHIDFMSVDVEGYDLEVLKTNDWDLFRPTFIVLETVEYSRDSLGEKLNNIYDPYMQSIGYEKIVDTRINTIYRNTKNF